MQEGPWSAARHAYVKHCEACVAGFKDLLKACEEQQAAAEQAQPPGCVFEGWDHARELPDNLLVSRLIRVVKLHAHIPPASTATSSGTGLAIASATKDGGWHGLTSGSFGRMDSCASNRLFLPFRPRVQH